MGRTEGSNADPSENVSVRRHRGSHVERQRTSDVVRLGVVEVVDAVPIMVYSALLYILPRYILYIILSLESTVTTNQVKRLTWMVRSGFHALR